MTRLTVNFAGTGAGAPTSERGAPAILVKRGGEAILFDCGEGTQISLRRFGFGLRGLKSIFITHMHGDHVLGIPGVIMSLSLNSRLEELHVFGPFGLDRFLKGVFDSAYFEPGFKVEIHVIEPTDSPIKIFEGKDYAVLSVASEHTTPSLAYALVEADRPGRFDTESALRLGVPEGELWKELQKGHDVVVGDNIVHPAQVLGQPRPGRRVVYSGDTRPCERVLRMGMKADVFIHEAAMPDDSLEGAIEGGHSTISEAIRVLVKSECRFGIITNFGQKVRFNDLEWIRGFGLIPASDGFSLDVPLVEHI